MAGMFFAMEIVQGEDYEVRFDVFDPSTSPPVPIDATSGYTLTGQVAEKFFTSEAPLYEWKEANGNVTLGNGWVKIQVPSAASRSWTFRRVFYDVEIKNNSTGKEIVIAYGPLILQPTIPRP
jgi:hypothetical protein